jgi:prepilin-type N-terminal cleavage/methylation domain-containing protein
MISHQHNYQLKERGFTIIELLIAITVFSVVLVMATTIMISIGNLFDKGVNQARTQDDARTILDDIAQHLQLGITILNPAAPVSQGGHSVYVLCADNTRYTYAPGVQIGSTPGTTLPHVLWRDTLVSGSSCLPATLTNASNPSGPTATGGAELMAPASRLSYFKLSSTVSPYTLDVGVTYGDPTLSPPAVGLNITCQGGSSSANRFCATSHLSTTVAERKN